MLLSANEKKTKQDETTTTTAAFHFRHLFTTILTFYSHQSPAFSLVTWQHDVSLLPLSCQMQPHHYDFQVGWVILIDLVIVGVIDFQDVMVILIFLSIEVLRTIDCQDVHDFLDVHDFQDATVTWRCDLHGSQDVMVLLICRGWMDAAWW